MTYRIRQIAVHSTSMSVAIVTGVFGAIIALVILPFAFIGASTAEAMGGVVGILLFPFLYLVFGYIFTAFWIILYNAVGSKTGGIEFELEEKTSGVIS